MTNTPQKTLIIIEAPAKEVLLSKILTKLQLNFNVASTSGHLKGFEKSLWPMSISKDLKPTQLRVLKPNAYLRVKTAIAEHEHIIIATDPDSEGHYIANDVFDLCKDKRVSRAYLYGMDHEHVASALKNLHPHDPQLAHKASRRKVVDRIICSALSNKDAGAYVGRVMTPTINRVSKTEQMPISIKQGVPFDGVEIVYHASAQLKETPSKTASVLQTIYERGRIAYHRSDSHRVTRSGAREVGIAYGRSLPVDNNADTGAHPAPYPIRPTIDVQMSLDQYNTEDAIIAIIARQWTNTPHEGAEYTRSHHFIEAMTDLNLGRPSTIPFTADRLAGSELLAPDGELTPKGVQWVEQGAPLLVDGAVEMLNSWIENDGDLDACFKKLGVDVIVQQNMDSQDNCNDLELGCNHSF